MKWLVVVFFSVDDLMATFPEFWLRHSFAFLFLLVWPLSALTSGLTIISACPCVVMPLVCRLSSLGWPFLVDWPGFVSFL